MTDALLFSLPSVPHLRERETYWWHVTDGEVVASGAGEEWLPLASGDRTRIALAPAAAVRLVFSDDVPAASTPRQAAAIARLAAIDSSLGDDVALHAVSNVDGAGMVTAVVENGRMLAWLDWARELGADPHHVVPVSILLPLTEEWSAAKIGGESIIGRRGLVLPDEPELAGQFTGGDPVSQLGEEGVAAALVRAAEEQPLDLRIGRFAKRRRIVIERNRIRELVLLAAAIPVITLAWALLSVLKLENATGRLNKETLAVAQAALGRAVTLETAESALAQRAGGSAFGGLMTPLTALYDALRNEQSVSATALSYGSDGTLSVTLAAPTVDAGNRVLIALQRNGYRITAVPRQAPDGRSVVETTIRSGP